MTRISSLTVFISIVDLHNVYRLKQNVPPHLDHITAGVPKLLLEIGSESPTLKNLLKE